MRRGIGFVLMLFPALFFAAPAPAPVPQTSSQMATQQKQIDSLQKQIADLQALITIQGRQINSLMLQQKQDFGELSGRVMQLESHASSVAPTPTVVSAPSAPEQTTAPSKEQQAFQAAYQLMQKRQYSDALKAFSDFIQQFPQSQQLPDAYYWQGEIYSVAGQDDQAKMSLETVVNQYPKSEKAAQALLKLGEMALEAEDYAAANTHWNTLIKQYPNTTAARVAKTQLSQLMSTGLAQDVK